MGRAQIIHTLLMVVILLFTSYAILRSWFFLTDVVAKKDFMVSIVEAKDAIMKVCSEGKGYERLRITVPRSSALIIYGCQELGGARVEPKDGPPLELDKIKPIAEECAKASSPEKTVMIIHALVEKGGFLGLSKETKWRYQSVLCGREFYGAAFGGGNYAAAVFAQEKTVFLRPEGG